jgi:endogenous inhibitor of DNA gyrase (YacG/DUF329 family)
MGNRRAVQVGPGSVAFKPCPVCNRQVLSAHRGEVTAVGKSEILSVTREGHVVGQCECGKRVTWTRGPARPMPRSR